ncbi:hypothetical protein [Marinobacter phage PS6]|nr:hypothetical protein [Marinobacter phage PS6]
MVESRLLEEHLNRQTATQAISIQLAIGSALSKEGNKAFKEFVKRMTNDGS